MKKPCIRKKKTATFLSLFLGEFGIHNFYLGYWFYGCIQMIFSLSSFFSFFYFGLEFLDSTLVGQVSVSSGVLTLDSLVIIVILDLLSTVRGMQILTGSQKDDAYGNPLV